MCARSLENAKGEVVKFPPSQKIVRLSHNCKVVGATVVALVAVVAASAGQEVTKRFYWKLQNDRLNPHRSQNPQKNHCRREESP